MLTGTYTTGPSRSLAWVLSLGVCAAGVGTAVSMVPAPADLADPVQAARIFLASVLMYTLCAGAAWVAVALGSLIPGLVRGALASTTYGLFLVATAVAAAVRIERVGSQGEIGPVRLTVIVVLVMMLGVMLLARTHRPPTGEREAHRSARLAWLPFAACLACGAVWFSTYASPASVLRALVWAALVPAGVLSVMAVRRLAARSLWLGFLPVTALLVASTWLASQVTLWAGRPRPDATPVVLLTVDTLRADALSFLADEGAPTPHLDGLFADSIVFSDARSPAPWTKPAVVSLLSGLSPIDHGVIGDGSVAPVALDLLPEVLHRSGYRTAAIGHNPFLRRHFGLAQGFDEFHMFPAAWGRSAGAWLMQRLGLGVPSTEGLADRTIAWLRSAGHGNFFLWVHVFDPHVPYRPPREYMPPDESADRVGDQFWQVHEVRYGELAPTPQEKQRILALYLAEVRYVDDQVGRILSALRDLGIYDAALIVFTSDHGEEFWDHAGFEHGHTLYDEVLRVPLAVKLPGSPKPRRIDAPVSVESVSASILEIVGIDDERQFVAPSLVPLLDAGSAVGPWPFFSTGLLHGPQRIALLEGGRKHMVSLDDGRYLAFDLQADPGEQDPVQGDAAEFAARLEAVFAQARDRRQALGIASATTSLDRETRARLRALGYIR